MIGNDAPHTDSGELRPCNREAVAHRLGFLATLLRLLAVSLAGLLAGCQETPRTSDPIGGLMVFVDLESNTPVVDLATTEVPAINPETGERTLMPGLYCPTCRRWHPAPAFDTLQRIPGAGRCPADGTPLTSDGPWPTGDN